MAVVVIGAEAFAADLLAAAEKVDTLVGVVVEKMAIDLVAQTQLRAGGRPGPNAPTGIYRASWEPQKVEEPDLSTVSWSAGTNSVQARRLEYGFVGPDSLGRVYDQAPLPHHGPAVDVIEPNFHDAMEAVARKATTW